MRMIQISGTNETKRGIKLVLLHYMVYYYQFGKIIVNNLIFAKMNFHCSSTYSRGSNFNNRIQFFKKKINKIKQIKR